MNTHTSQYLTGDTAFAIDHRGIIILWNEAAEESLGFPASEALGQKCWKLLGGQDDYGNRYCCKHCPIREMNFRHEPVHSFHTSFKTASNQHKHFSVSCLTIFDEPGKEMLLHICRPENDGAVAENYAPPRPPTSQLGELSQRELEVLIMLADEVKTRDIAENLSISIRTVRTHIQHLMYKLQVHKRSEAIKVAKRLHLI